MRGCHCVPPSINLLLCESDNWFTKKFPPIWGARRCTDRSAYPIHMVWFNWYLISESRVHKMQFFSHSLLTFGSLVLTVVVTARGFQPGSMEKQIDQYFNLNQPSFLKTDRPTDQSRPVVQRAQAMVQLSPNPQKRQPTEFFWQLVGIAFHWPIPVPIHFI